ncbi:hypothetical protein [Kitasatospora griseola]
MSPQQRLDSILGSASLQAFAPFGAGGRPAVCFSESPESHLVHLIAVRGFAPWGIAVTRAQFVANGGGAVAYLPDRVVKDKDFPADMRHWVVPIRTDGELGDWSHEREWRLPMPKMKKETQEKPDTYYPAIGFRETTFLRAVLIGDPNWRPTPVSADGQTELPRLWREAQEIWVWNSEGRIDKYSPGELN